MGVIDFQHLPFPTRDEAKHSNIRLIETQTQNTEEMTHRQDDNVEKVKGTHYTIRRYGQPIAVPYRRWYIPIIEKAWTNHSVSS
jgi:hypothetical protein